MAQPYSPPCQDSRIRSEPCPKAAGRLPPRRIQSLGLAACVLASSMAFIDGSALTVALPALKDEFGGNVLVVQWVLNGYILALASLTMIGGALADALGRARILTWGTAAFALTSVMCALAPTASVLVGARLAQGAAAALVAPASLALIGELFEQSQRTRAIGIWAAMSSLATAGGPLLGGWLTEVFSWRAVFWINLPIGAVALLLLVALPNRPASTPRRFDVPGSILLALGLLALVAALSGLGPSEGSSDVTSGEIDWPMTALALLATVGLFAAFWTWQGKTDAPLVPRYVFSGRRFTGLNLATVAIYLGLSMMFFLLPFELVERRGMGPLQSGLVFLPFTLCVAFLSPVFGSLSERTGLKTMLTIGAILASIGFAWLAVDQGAAVWRSLIVPMTIAGLAFAIIVAPLTAGVMTSVDAADEGLASGINNTASRVAQMIGVALASLFIGSSAGYVTGLWLAAASCLLGAVLVWLTFHDGFGDRVEPVSGQ